LPDRDLNVDRGGQQPKVSKVALKDNSDIRLSAFPLNQLGKDNFYEFFYQSLMTSTLFWYQFFHFRLTYSFTHHYFLF